MDSELHIEITTLIDAQLPLAPGHPHRTPQAFQARITPANASLPTCELTIDRFTARRTGAELGEMPELRALTITARPGCPQLDSSNTRVPVGRYFRAAVAEAARQSADGAELEPVPEWRRTRGRRITSEQLERVTTIYRRAVTEGKHPLRELERELGVARSSAARLVGQARAEGLLGPPPRPGIAGERPVS